MNESSGAKTVRAGTKVKRAVVRTSLLATGVTFELASRFSRDLKDEIADWPEGLVFTMGTLPSGPYMSVKKEGDRIRYLGAGMKDPDVAILFKNLDAALMVFTGQIGTPAAAAQHRFIVHGNISTSMKISRALSLVQMFLFPGFILKKTFKTPPRLTASQMATKGIIMAALTPALLWNAPK